MTCALVLGGAGSLPNDLFYLAVIARREIRKVNGLCVLEWDGPVVATNDAGHLWGGRLDHWVSLHPERFPEWGSLRSVRGYPGGYLRWTADGWQDRGGAVDKVISEDNVDMLVGGSSGLVATAVAMTLADRVVLAGMPIDRSVHVAGNTAKGRFSTDDEAADAKKVGGYREAWEAHMALPGWSNRVRSCSGWTKQRLGLPNEGFIKGAANGA